MAMGLVGGATLRDFDFLLLRVAAALRLAVLAWGM
jgi:hypothetical protein